MSKKPLANETLSEEALDSPFPIRRSTRISQISSPAPKSIVTRRSSANSIERTLSESPGPEKKKTRRASTETEPTPIRTRRSSASKLIEESKLTSTPSSPSVKRNTRSSTQSPSKTTNVPARRTRRSVSREQESLEEPSLRLRSTRSTDAVEEELQESVEKAKPVSRRRRSSSVEEETCDTNKAKTKKLFVEDSPLEPIEEQETEVNENDSKENKSEKDLQGDKMDLSTIQETEDSDIHEMQKENSDVDKLLEKRIITSEEKTSVPEKVSSKSIFSPVTPNKCQVSKSPKSSVPINGTDDIKDSCEKDFENIAAKEVIQKERELESEENISTQAKIQESSEKKENISEKIDRKEEKFISLGSDDSFVFTLNTSEMNKTQFVESDTPSPGSNKENTSLNTSSVSPSKLSKENVIKQVDVSVNLAHINLIKQNIEVQTAKPRFSSDLSLEDSNKLTEVIEQKINSQDTGINVALKEKEIASSVDRVDEKAVEHLKSENAIKHNMSSENPKGSSKKMESNLSKSISTTNTSRFDNDCVNSSPFKSDQQGEEDMSSDISIKLVDTDEEIEELLENKEISKSVTPIKGSKRPRFSDGQSESAHLRLQQDIRNEMFESNAASANNSPKKVETDSNPNNSPVKKLQTNDDQKPTTASSAFVEILSSEGENSKNSIDAPIANQLEVEYNTITPKDASSQSPNVKTQNKTPERRLKTRLSLEKTNVADLKNRSFSQKLDVSSEEKTSESLEIEQDKKSPKKSIPIISVKKQKKSVSPAKKSTPKRYSITADDENIENVEIEQESRKQDNTTPKKSVIIISEKEHKKTATPKKSTPNKYSITADNEEIENEKIEEYVDLRESEEKRGKSANPNKKHTPSKNLTPQSKSSKELKSSDNEKNGALDSDSMSEDFEMKHEYIDDMAEEGEEDTPSEDSNAIIDEGESINSTESEPDTDESYDMEDSFITDDEEVELLSGNEYDVDMVEDFEEEGKKPTLSKNENRSNNKRRRILQQEDSTDEEIPIISPKVSFCEKVTIITQKQDNKENAKEVSFGKNQNPSTTKSSPYKNKDTKESQKNTSLKDSSSFSEKVETPAVPPVDVQTIDSTSDEEIEMNEVVATNTEKTPFEERLLSLVGSKKSSTPNCSFNEAINMSKHNTSAKSSSITLHENVSVSELQEGVLSDKLQQVVKAFCAGIKDTDANVSLNVSLDYMESASTPMTLKKESSYSSKLSPSKQEKRELNSSLLPSNSPKINKKSMNRSKDDIGKLTGNEVKKENEIQTDILQDNERKSIKKKRSKSLENSSSNQISPSNQLENSLQKVSKASHDSWCVQESSVTLDTSKNLLNCSKDEKQITGSNKKRKSLKLQEESFSECQLSTLQNDNSSVSKKSPKIQITENVSKKINRKSSDKTEKLPDQSVEWMQTVEFSDMVGVEEYCKVDENIKVLKKKKPGIVIDNRKVTTEDKLLKKNVKGERKRTVEESIPTEIYSKVAKRSKVSKTESQKLSDIQKEISPSPQVERKRLQKLKSKLLEETKNTLLKSLVTDVRKRPQRVIKPSSPTKDSSWIIEDDSIRPSATNPPKCSFNYNKISEKDFKNQMLYDPRIKREATSNLLKKKGFFVE